MRLSVAGLGMDEGQNLTRVASLIADPTRAEMLVMLMGGQAFPVSDLAAGAHVSLPTASHHLSKLVDGGLVSVVRQGRHRYHRIASDVVASLIESLGVAASSAAGRRVGRSPKQQALDSCRSCYNHLAGEIGVRIRISLESRLLIREAESGYAVTPCGSGFLGDLGMERANSLMGKVCLDWTERVPHIGGPLGTALFEELMSRGWFERGEIPRVVRLTALGSRLFVTAFPIE